MKKLTLASVLTLFAFAAMAESQVNESVVMNSLNNQIPNTQAIAYKNTVNGEVLLSGKGYAHYHIYPDVGQCYRGIVDFTKYDKMLAAVSPSIHHYFDDQLGTRDLYVEVTAVNTGEVVTVIALDKGGSNTNDFNKIEQHIMDLSQVAFNKLDVDGAGYQAGRIYISWKIFEKKAHFPLPWLLLIL